jgi:uncharacterized protein with NRDE domain
MCLVVFAWKVHPRYRLILAANRDEYHERRSSPLAQWKNQRDILAGRDLQAGGTWLAIDRHGRFGVVTNFRDLQPPLPGARSRGELIPAYLSQSASTSQYVPEIESNVSDYSGFNLLLGDADSMWYVTNRAERGARELTPGVYGLGNQLLDTPSPKVTRVLRGFESAIQMSAVSSSTLFQLLSDRTQCATQATDAPSSIGPDLQRALAAPFVAHSIFGTRCSTALLIGTSGEIEMSERRFDADGTASGDSLTRAKEHEWLDNA